MATLGATNAQNAKLNKERLRQQQVANAQSYFAMAQQNPAFAFGKLLGEAIGNGMIEHADRRGNEKLDEILKAAQEENAPISVNGNVGVTGNGVPIITPLDNTGVSSQSVSGNGGNVTGSGTDYVNQALANMKAQQATQSIAGMPSNYNMQYIKDQARKQGVADFVLDERMGDIQKGIAQKANEVLMPQIQRNLYGYNETDEQGNVVYHAPTDASRIEALQQLQELKKYDPTTADAYISNTVKGMDQRQLADMAQQYKMDLLDKTNANKMAMLNARNYTTLQNTQLKNQGKGQELKPADRIALEKHVSELEARVKEKYPNNVDLNDVDVINYRNSMKRLGYGDPFGSKQETTENVGNAGNTKNVGATNKNQQKVNIKEAFSNKLNSIDVGDWNSINKNGLELVDMLRKNGMSYNEAMENVLKVLKPKISEEEYAAFKGDFETAEDRELAKQNTLNWGGRGKKNTVDDALEFIADPDKYRRTHQ